LQTHTKLADSFPRVALFINVHGERYIFSVGAGIYVTCLLVAVKNNLVYKHKSCYFSNKQTIHVYRL